MVAKLEILGWSSVGLRCPDHQISCTSADGQPHAVTLVQMPNGTGKTTTLNLLRLALSGKWQKKAPSVADVQKLKKRGGPDKGNFELVLKLNDHRVTIQMLFDFSVGRVRYRTTRNAGLKESFDPPAEFRKFLSEEFVSFFVFDGELAANLLDEDETQAELVIETLFQLGMLKSMSEKVAAYWQARAEGSGDPDVASRTKKVSKARQRLTELERLQRALLEEKNLAVQTLQTQQLAYQTELKKRENVAKQVMAADERRREARENVRNRSLDLLQELRGPHALAEVFANDIFDLKINLDKAKLPGTAAREFFQDLATEEYCVCGTQITSEVSEAIRKRAGLYLGSEEVGFLNAMKTDIDRVVGVSRTAPAEAADLVLGDLETLVALEREASNEFDALSEEAEGGDPNVARAAEEIRLLTERLQQIEDELERFEDKESNAPNEQTWGIEVMRKRFELHEKKLAQATATLTLQAKRDILVGVLARAHRLAREGLTSEICAEANERLHDLMPHNDIQIDRIERCLKLRGQEGGSAGEQLSIAYGFLATLFKRADHQLPFVVDSPAGPIDLEIRPQIGALIPKLTEQFIAFTISSERAGFVPPLASASAAPVQFLTVFRKGPAAIETRARVVADARETTDGWVVPGQTFFETFQLDKEEEAA